MNFSNAGGHLIGTRCDENHSSREPGSTTGSGNWKKLSKGFPKKERFYSVQRDAMDIDSLKSPALYFGTTTGQVWIGRDGGEKWDCLFDSLPPVHRVKVAVV